MMLYVNLGDETTMTSRPNGGLLALTLMAFYRMFRCRFDVFEYRRVHESQYTISRVKRRWMSLGQETGRAMASDRCKSNRSKKG
jgi:hypothetical protein